MTRRKAKIKPELPAKILRTLMLFPWFGKPLNCSKVNEAVAKSHCLSKVRRVKIQLEYPAETFRTPMLFRRLEKAINFAIVNEAATKSHC